MRRSLPGVLLVQLIPQFRQSLRPVFQDENHHKLVPPGQNSNDNKAILAVALTKGTSGYMSTSTIWISDGES